jgi:hypothetical protein
MSPHMPVMFLMAKKVYKREDVDNIETLVMFCTLLL